MTALRPLLTLREVAGILGVSRSGLYHLLAKRELPAPMRIGRASRWDPAELEAWIRTRPRGVAPLPSQLGGNPLGRLQAVETGRLERLERLQTRVRTEVEP